MWRCQRPRRPWLPIHPSSCSQHCRSLQQLHLELPPPSAPLSGAAAAVARALAGGPLAAPPPPAAALAAAAADVGCPPVDGYIVKLLAQSCPRLSSLRLVNVTNNAAISRLVGAVCGCGCVGGGRGCAPYRAEHATLCLTLKSRL
jgi:hypothetical protein